MIARERAGNDRIRQFEPGAAVMLAGESTDLFKAVKNSAETGHIHAAPFSAEAAFAYHRRWRMDLKNLKQKPLPHSPEG